MKNLYTLLGRIAYKTSEAVHSYGSSLGKVAVTVVIFFIAITNSFSQCTNCSAQYPAATQSINAGVSNQNISTCMFGGEYAICNVVNGSTYTWTTCGDTDFDTQITVRNNNGTCTGAVYAYNDDFCGTQSQTSWTATFTGTVRVLVSKYSCASQSTCMTLNWSRSAPPCTPPAVVGFGVNTWNVLGYQHTAYNYANLATLTGETFKGYYTDATVDINSELRWGATLSPSSATPYTGCPITVDNHTVVYKRQGFPNAFYQIDLNTHDDGVQCYVNGTLVYQIDGCCADRGVIWSGRLCSTSTVEFRVMEGGGGSNLNVDFIDVPFTAGTISGTQSICPSGTSALTTTGNPGGTWTSSNTAVATVSSTGLVSAIGSGSSTITYTVNGGACGNATATLPITVVPGASAGVLSGTQTVCSGSTTTFTTNGNSGGTWTSDNTAIATVNGSTGVVTGVGAGTATITYTVLGAGGCPNAAATRTVTVIATPTSNAGSDVTLCPSQTTVLNGSSNMSDSYVYTLTMNDSWGDGWDGAYLTAYINGVSAGTYAATGTGSTATINVTPGQAIYFIYTPASFENEHSYTIALNGSTVYTAGPNPATGTVYTNSNPQTVTYAWTPATDLSSASILAPTCSATTTTNYTLTVTKNGCSSSDQVTITVIPGTSAGVLSGAQTVCVGSTTTFTSNGSAGGLWTSSNAGVASVNASTGVVSGITAGTAIITYTIAGVSGCPDATATRTVTVFDVPTSNAGSDVTLCPSQSTVLNGTSNMSDSYAYTLTMNDSYGDGWNGGFLTAFINGTASGTYSALGAVTTATINILPGQTLYFTYTAGSWEGENSYSIALNGATVYSGGPTPATGTVYTNNSHPQTVTYAWTPATDLSSASVLAPTCTPSATTAYSFTVTKNGCSSTDQVTITVLPGASAGVISGTQTACIGSTTTFTSTGASGGTWSSDNAAVATVNSSTGEITGVSAGTATITYTVLGVGGCPNATATRTVTINSIPTSNAGSDITICPGQMTVLNGSSNMSDSYVYTLTMNDSWGDGWNGGFLTAFVNGTSAGTYSASGLSSTATVNVTPGEAIYFTYTSGSWEAENSYTIALNGTTVYTGGPTPTTGTVYSNSNPVTVSYAWTPSATLISSTVINPTATPTGTTTYSLTVTKNGCSSTDDVLVSWPLTGSTLSQDNENATCIVNQFGWVHFYHSSGRLIASVNSQGQDLGAVTATSYVEGAPVSVDACGNNNPIYATTVMGRHWVITPTNQPTSAVLVRLPYGNTEFSDLTSAASTNANSNDDLLTPSDLGLSKYSNGTNANVNDVATDNCGVGATTFHTQTGNGAATSYSSVNASYADFSIPGFSEFWLHGSAQSSPLPVELVNFQANCAGEGKVNVTWATASEHNSANFTVEKSRDGMNWTVMASLTGAGNSTQMINYSTVDNNAAAGVNYYRLTQTDFDGASETFNIASANCGDNSPLTTVKVYPNPSAGDFYIDFNSEEIIGSSVISITDARGMEVYKMNVTVEKGSNVFHIENMEAAPGIYYIQVSNGTATSNIVKHSLR